MYYLSLNNLGILYRKQGEIDKALEYYEKSLEAVKADNNLAAQINTMSNISNIFMEKEQYDTCEVLLKSCLSLSKQLNSPFRILNLQIRLGELYTKMGNYQAVENILQTIDTANSEYLKNYDYQSHFYLLQGKLNFHQKSYSAAIKSFKKYEQIASESQDIEGIMNANWLLFETSELQGNYQAALDYHILYKEYSDSILNDANQKTLMQNQMRYEFDKEKTVYDTERELLETKLSTQKTVRIGILILLFITLISAIYIINFYKLKNKQLQTDLENKRKIAEQANQIQQLLNHKSSLFANIAHELKTPLMLITEPLQKTLKSTHILNSDKQHLSTAYNNSLQLKRLTGQILDIIKLEKNKLVATPQFFSLKSLVFYLEANFNPLAQYHQIQFITPNLVADIDLVTDADKLIIILNNLLSNAFKFTSTGGQVSLNITTIEDKIQFSIEDNGTGIKAKDLEAIFEKYYQTQNTVVPNNGIGLGLAICKEYAKALEGKIAVRSEYGQGSIFTLTIPQKLTIATENVPTFHFHQYQSPNEITTTTNGTTPITSTKKSRLLIVEDNPEIVVYIQELLGELYQISAAPNGIIGLEYLEKEKFDLIISDIMMPVMDGLTFLKQVKATAKWRHIHFLILTALEGKQEKIETLRIGVDDYITKPFDGEILKARVEGLLDYYEERLQNHQTEVTENTPIISNPDTELLIKIETIIKQNLSDTNFNMNLLADNLNMSYSNLFPTIKRITGLTPNQYFNEVRFASAKRMLENREYDSVKAVAYTIGFKEVRYFSRQFKKRFGKNPSVFLEQV